MYPNHTLADVRSELARVAAQPQDEREWGNLDQKVNQDTLMAITLVEKARRSDRG